MKALNICEAKRVGELCQFRELCDSKLSGLDGFDNMVITH